MKIKRLLKDRRGFTIMEAVIAIALLLIVTGAFLTTCIVASNLQRRSADTLAAGNIASEFISAYNNAQTDGADGGETHDFLYYLSISLGFDVNGIESDPDNTVENGDSTLSLTKEGDTRTYEYNTGNIRIEAVIFSNESSEGIVVNGYVNSFSSAVFTYEGGAQ